jgi:hypothetical protein
MRIMRKIMLLSVVAVAAMAMSAASASALSVVTESTGIACTAITQPTHSTSTSTGSGGCLLKATGSNVELHSSILGATGVCTNTFEGRTNGSGVGFIYNPSITGCVGSAFHPCEETAGVETWPLRLLSETSIEATFCVHLTGDPFHIDARCHLDALTLADVGSHTYRISTIADLANGHQLCEGSDDVEGIWNQVVDAAHPKIEVRD